MKKKVKLYSIIQFLISKFFANSQNIFLSSKEYWDERYRRGGNSGAGSYNLLAEFKAQVLNGIVKKEKLEKIIEYGCGDGNQLKLAEYPSYIGFDVSETAISLCSSISAEDKSKVFRLISEYQGEIAELTLSLDVVYHLIEDDVFFQYMERLFSSSSRFVIIYSSNFNSDQLKNAPHVRHRKFTDWIEANCPEWELLQYIPNKYPIEKDSNRGSFADFYIYRKAPH